MKRMRGRHHPYFEAFLGATIARWEAGSIKKRKEYLLRVKINKLFYTIDFSGSGTRMWQYRN